MRLLLLLMSWTIATLAWGYGDPTEVFGSYSQVRFGGDLARSERTPALMLQSRKVPKKTISMTGSIRRHAVGIGLDLVRLRSQFHGDDFPYTYGSDLNFLGFFIIPTTCFFVQWERRLCLGLGIGTLNVNSRDSERDYGTWNYQVDLHQDLSERFFVKLLAKYLGKIEQRQEDRQSSFWLSFVGASLGFRY